jgi:hypothetical protein
MVLRQLADWVLNQIVQDVPESNGLCEYDCRRLECSHGEWETCERRLNRAGGELMPAHAAFKKVPSEPADDARKRQSFVSLTVH